MELMEILMVLIQNVPTTISMVLSVFAISMAIYLNGKKIKNESRSTEIDVHEKQVKLLLSQVEILSKDLATARDQLNIIHNQNIELMKQLRDANARIGELEILLSQSRFE